MAEEDDYINVPKTTEQSSSDLKRYMVKRAAVGVVSAAFVLAVIVGIRTVTHLITRGETTEPQINGTPTSPTSPATTIQPTTCEGKPSCDDGWWFSGTKCYLFSTEEQTWSNSRKTCQQQNGDLVKIESREEQRAVVNKVVELMKTYEDKFWIGLTDAETEGQWKWTDGSPLDTSLTFWFNHTNQKEPDNWTNNGTNPDGEDCVRMGEKSADFVEKCWFDQRCDAEQRFICEKNPTTVCVQ